MIYAPVCIPTLNRYEHLRKCLESLSCCMGADQTEVYVALDYPPLDKWDKYAPGWEKNKEFLHSCGDMGFKKLHLIERMENYGTWKSGDKGNSKHLGMAIREKYDRYIFTEDDNVFSPNFLDCMNKGLEMFYDDERTVSICGYRHFYPIKYDNNTYFRQSVDYNAWGIGCWTHKVKNKPKLDYHWFRKHLSLKNCIRVYKTNGRGKLLTFLNACQRKWDGQVIDQYQSVYLTLTNKNQIMPTISLVRNIGLDESGASFGKIDDELHAQFDNAPVSSEQTFEFIGTGYEYFEENQRIYRDGNFLTLSNWLFFKSLIKKIIKVILYP